MAAIGVRNRQLRAVLVQCTASDGEKRDPTSSVVNLVIRPRPSGSKVSIVILRPMHNGPPCTEMVHPTSHCAHCPHRRIFQVIFGNRDGGELGGFPLQGILLIV